MITAALVVLSGVVGLLLAFLAAECWTALLPLRRHQLEASIRRDGACAIVIPAHDEQSQIVRTIGAVAGQLQAGDRLIVVADNCRDRTAELALAAGAEVWPRSSPDRGKGYALRFAIGRLGEAPPETVIVVDADCEINPGCIERLARVSQVLGRPVQAAYWMLSDGASDSRSSVSAFAVFVKNVVRPRALQRWGAPCLITGSGVAYPWDVLSSVPMPGADIVEDMAYAVRVAIAGRPTAPCIEAEVFSPLPTTQHGARSQRLRWEHGHLQTLLRLAPKLIYHAVVDARPSLLLLALELATPPLTMLAIGSLGTLTLTIAWWASGGSSLPLSILLTSGGLAASGLAAIWWVQGQSVLKTWQLLGLPRYLLSKLPIYAAFVGKRQQAWVRTERAGELRFDAAATSLQPTRTTARSEPSLAGAPDASEFP